MFSTRRPYLILPKLIEQPTWGGDYIIKLKNWSSKDDLSSKKIGQSYELFSGSKLLLNITDTAHANFSPDATSVSSVRLLTHVVPNLEARKWMMVSIPFVVYGIARYAQLLYEKAQGERPEQVITTDIPLIVTIGAWGLIIVGLIYVF